MKVNHAWLQKYFKKPLPSSKELMSAITFHAFEVEGVEKVGEDSIIDIDVLPNRSSDCLSHRGIAKDISVILNTVLTDDPLRHEVTLSPESKVFAAEIADQKLCRRFSGAVITDVKVGPSPEWLVKALESLGQKSINNVVDATNYVMFDLGQPLHAFDKKKLTEKGGKTLITVRTAKKGEKVTVLSGEEHELGDETLLITDGNSGFPIGIAGIKGGKLTEIDESTTEIIIEAANFHPTNIRKSSQFLKLRTDASARFENEVPIELSAHALSAVVKLVIELAGGSLEGCVDIYPQQKYPYKVGVSVKDINKRLGSKLKEKDVEDILNRFGFEYKKVSPINTVVSLAPTYEGTRYKYFSSLAYDGTATFDCSSFTRHLYIEAGVGIPLVSIDQYVYGEEIVKSGQLLPGDLVFSVGEDTDKIHHKTVVYMPETEVPVGVSHCGVYLGDGIVAHASGSRNKVVIEQFDESPDFKNIVGFRRMLTEVDDRYVVTVPFERTDINIAEDLIEEIGRIHGYAKIPAQRVTAQKRLPRVNKGFYYAEKIRHVLESEGFSEVYTSSFNDHGEVELENALASDKNWLRVNLKEQIVKQLKLNLRNRDLLGLSEIRLFEIGTVFTKKGEHASLALGVAGMKKVGGELSRVIDVLSKELGTSVQGKEKDGVIEINFSSVVEKLLQPEYYDSYTLPREKGVSYKPISSYPFVLRDIACWVPQGTKESELLEMIQKEAGELSVNATLFDVFEKDDRKSYAFRLVFQSREKTLSDEEVNAVMKKIEAALSESGFEVR